MGGVKLFSLMGKLAIDGVDESKQSLEEVSKKGEDTKNKLGVSFKKIATEVGDMGKKMAKGLLAFGTGVVATVEASREMREDFGKLDTAFKTTGSSTETANKVFKELYGTLGENDRSIEAANHLAMLTNNEKDLSTWTDICTGIYATFGDSLPIEGLTEAANETAKTGELTGVLVDAINWAKISNEEFGATLGSNKAAQKAFNDAIAEGENREDAFKAALEACKTEAEREQLIRETLNSTYKEAGDTYKKVNGDVIANNKSQADLNKQLADATAKIEPLITKGKEFLVKVLEKAQPLIDWVVKHFDVIAPIILGIVGALGTFSVVMGVVNAVMMASPVTWIVLGIVAAITALVAIIVIVVKKWDEIKQVASNVWNGIKEIWGAVAEWFKTNVIDPVVGFFQGLWEGLKTIWNGIVETIKFVFNLIVAIITTYFQLITLPFRFIWENCKDTIISVFNAIKDFISNIINTIKDVIVTVFTAIKNFFSTIWNGIKSVFTTVWNAIVNFLKPILETIKNVISTVFNAVKTTITNIWNGIKTTVSNVVNGIKNTVSSVFNGLKSVVSNVWNGIKTAITTPIEKARDVVKGVIDKIKGFFNFKVELPKIKLPHFGITPSGWKIGDLLKGSIPKLSIKWNKEGAIFNKPTIFDTRYGFQGAGEDGAEAIAPISKLMDYTRLAVDGSNAGLEDKLDNVIKLLQYYLPFLKNMKLVMDTGTLVGEIVDPMDKALAEKSEDRKRGR